MNLERFPKNTEVIEYLGECEGKDVYSLAVERTVRPHHGVNQRRRRLRNLWRRLQVLSYAREYSHPYNGVISGSALEAESNRIQELPFPVLGEKGAQWFAAQARWANFYTQVKMHGLNERYWRDQVARREKHARPKGRLP